MLITDFFDKFEYILITELFTENNDSQQRDLSICWYSYRFTLHWYGVYGRPEYGAGYTAGYTVFYTVYSDFQRIFV